MARLWIGAAFGITLFVLCFAIAGFGHGYFLPAAIAAWPIMWPPGILCIPFLWVFWAWIALNKRRLLFPLLMVAAYASITAVGLFIWRDNVRQYGTEFLHDAKFAALKPELVAFVITYLLANIWLWFSYLCANKLSEQKAISS